MTMAIKTPPPNPHQEAINNLASRVLPRVRALPFAKNTREPWLGNVTVDKAVLATIEAIFAIADEDAAKAAAPVIVEATGEPSVLELPEMDQG